jgi:uncharacterized protein YsxB (DUF464 family)
MTDNTTVAIIAAVAPVLTVLVTWLNSRGKLRQIQTMVNGNLDAATLTIERQRTQIETMHMELMQLREIVREYDSHSDKG